MRPQLSAALICTLAGATHAAPAVPSGFPANVDLSQLNGTNGIQLAGVSGADFLGASVSTAGDFNGDGIDDVVLAVPYASNDNDEFVPQAYIVFGSPDRKAGTVDIDPVDAINVIRIKTNPRAFGLYAYSDICVSAAGDINGDSISDIIIGVSYAHVDANEYAGQAFVIFGKDTAQDGTFPLEIDVADLDGTNGFAINGINAFDRLGASVASAGDFNADKVGDIIIGSPYADPVTPVALGAARTDAGRAFVIFGKDTARADGFPAVFDLTTLNGSNGFAIDGIDNFDRCGTSVASAGDVNADKITDLIIGAPVAAGGGGPGAAFVVYGRKPRPSSPFPALFELALIDGTNGFRINGIDDGDFCGQTVSSAGDVNGDKISDIVVGAIRANDQAGETYVIFGRKTPFTHPFNPSLLDGTNGFFVRGNASNDECGWSLAPIGDFNRDKIADLAVSGRGFDSNTGATFVIFGKNTARSGSFPASFLPGSFDGVQGMRFNGGAQFDEAGQSIAAAGDFNGDSSPDLLIGAPHASGGDGEAYVVYGPSAEVDLRFQGVDSVALDLELIDDGGTLGLGNLTVGALAIPTFQIRNKGLAELTLAKFKFPRGFSLIAPPTSPVDALGSQSFSIGITPTRTGNFSGKASFTTNDADEKKFDFTMTWTVVDTLASSAPDTNVIDVDSIIDLNDDWATNATDLVLMLRAMSSADSSADLNDDDRVDSKDLAILLTHLATAR